MSRLLRNILLLISPFLLMVLINEMVRPTMSGTYAYVGNAQAMNSWSAMENKCSWACHQDTGFCKKHHVKLLKPYFSYTDKAYFGIIDSLHSTGDYYLANIIVLVIVFPLMMYLLLVKSLDIWQEIKALK